MDTFSYLLGKKASGGGGGGGDTPDLSEYFNTTISNNTSQNNNFTYDIVKKTAPFNLSSNVTELIGCFYNCEFIKELDVSQMDTSNITKMEKMFYNCNKLENIDLSNFDVSKVTTFKEMFYACSSLKKLDLSKWTTRLNVNSTSMFAYCYKVAVLDISSMNSFNTGAFISVGTQCLKSDGAYADGIPYVYVKNETLQSQLVSGSYSAPSTWTTDNVIVKG